MAAVLSMSAVLPWEPMLPAQLQGCFAECLAVHQTA